MVKYVFFYTIRAMINIILIVLGVLLAGSLVFSWLVYQRVNSKKNENEYGVLHQRMDSVTQLILNQLKENKESAERSSVVFNQQTQGFISGITQLQEKVNHVQESVKGVVSFQNIFKSPKLRGQWGETSLEAVIGQFFPKELYALQHYFKNGEAVDAVLKLPNERLVPIDSKFNWENFERMTQAEDEINRDIFRKNFLGDIKKKIDEIASKYIRPSEDTVDLALMYIPAEGVYYEIVNQIKEADISAYARSKKIILVSPNTFYLTLSAIQHWFRDVQITKQTKEIIKRLSWISKDAEKLDYSFKRLGKHLSDAKSSYDDSEQRLSLMTNRVQNVVGGENIESQNKSSVEVLSDTEL